MGSPMLQSRSGVISRRRVSMWIVGPVLLLGTASRTCLWRAINFATCVEFQGVCCVRCISQPFDADRQKPGFLNSYFAQFACRLTHLLRITPRVCCSPRFSAWARFHRSLSVCDQVVHL